MSGLLKNCWNNKSLFSNPGERSKRIEKKIKGQVCPLLEQHHPVMLHPVSVCKLKYILECLDQYLCEDRKTRRSRPC